MKIKKPIHVAVLRTTNSYNGVSSNRNPVGPSSTLASCATFGSEKTNNGKQKMLNNYIAEGNINKLADEIYSSEHLLVLLIDYHPCSEGIDATEIHSRFTTIKLTFSFGFPVLINVK